MSDFNKTFDIVQSSLKPKPQKLKLTSKDLENDTKDMLSALAKSLLKRR